MEPMTKWVGTIGVFDGVHRGHRELIREGLLLKRNFAHSLQQKVQLKVFTFSPHPDEFFERKYEPLFDLSDRLQTLKSMGADDVIVLRFDQELSRLNPQQFLSRVGDPEGCLGWVLGSDFRFAFQRKGGLAELRAFYPSSVCKEVCSLETQGYRISSTQIKSFVREGQMEKVHEFLGRPFYLQAPIQSGLSLGRKLGAPTANLIPGSGTLPKLGVYITRSTILNSGVSQDSTDEKSSKAVGNLDSNLEFDFSGHYPILPSITNVGVRPTLDSLHLRTSANAAATSTATANNAAPVAATSGASQTTPSLSPVSENEKIRVETHILEKHFGFEELSGKLLKVEFLKFLRPEIKFNSLEDLQSQIQKDVETVKAWWGL